ncbi:unnamed protein product [Lota lota]
MVLMKGLFIQGGAPSGGQHGPSAVPHAGTPTLGPPRWDPHAGGSRGEARGPSEQAVQGPWVYGPLVTGTSSEEVVNRTPERARGREGPGAPAANG